MAERAVYLRRFTNEYIVQLCQINHIDVNEIKTKQDMSNTDLYPSDLFISGAYFLVTNQNIIN